MLVSLGAWPGGLPSSLNRETVDALACLRPPAASAPPTKPAPEPSMPAPERPLGWLLGGRDGRLLLGAVGAVLGAPVAALAAITATSALSLGLRVGFLRRPPAG